VRRSRCTDGWIHHVLVHRSLVQAITERGDRDVLLRGAPHAECAIAESAEVQRARGRQRGCAVDGTYGAHLLHFVTNKCPNIEAEFCSYFDAKRGTHCVVFIAERTGERQRPRLEQWDYTWLNGNVHVQRRICAHWRGIARVRKQRVERCCADVHCGSMRGVGVD